MIDKDLIEPLDSLVRPLGFVRFKTVWNRRSENVVQVLDVEVNKAGDRVTMNAGVLDREVHERVWGTEHSGVARIPECTVRARVGQLVDGKDLWWPVGDKELAERLVRTANVILLPFLGRMINRTEMETWLTDSGVLKQKYPLPILNLAVVKHFLRKTSEACGLLERLSTTTWRDKGADVSRRLGCTLESGCRSI